jgi:hypothetical protein
MQLIRDLMTTLALPSFHSPPILVHHLTSIAFHEFAPWRGILAVEPDIARLNAGSLLLTKAKDCVTGATSDRELFALQGKKAFALARLSHRLGLRLRGTVAETVRRQSPRARILILGQVAPGLHDHLYDEQIYRFSDPEKVLADLEKLYMGMWDQRSKTLDWDAARSARNFARPPIYENDPTKTIESAPARSQSLHDGPSDLRLPNTSRS